jgi:hypothetical protein
MTVPLNPNRNRRSDDYSLPVSDSSKARLFLAVACIWPFLILALFGASAPRIESAAAAALSPDKLVAVSSTKNQRLNVLRNVLDRVDIMGYGPTHPRVAVIIVGDDKDNIMATLESVFRSTDLNRIFVACVVVDGHAQDMALVRDLEKIDSGVIPHWHGLRPDLHEAGQKEVDGEDPHGRKVHVFFNEEKKGLTDSRADAVQFIQILTKYHEDAGLKSPEEDLILLLLQSGAQLTSRRWLTPVTEALIVPPPILGEGDTTVAMKIANAVSFNLEGASKRTSFDTTFTPLISEPSATDLNLSSGASYPTPVMNGAAMAMRLDTYVNLPLQDLSLKDAWPANLDLSLNLWLCADGIDMLKDLTVTSFEQTPAAPLSPEMAARFAAAWMDETTSKRFFNAYTKTFRELTYLEWETFQAQAREAPTFTKGLPQKCRSFEWYAQEINPDIGDFLKESEVVQHEIEDEKKKDKREGVESDFKAHADFKVDLPDKPLAVPQVKDEDRDIEDVSIPERKGDKRKPSKPLCDECLEIVQKAKPVDITFVDVSNGHKEHPHMGALDENGNPGYIHDETALRKNPPPFNFGGEELRNECKKRDNDYEMLHKKVFVDIKADEEANKSGRKRDKIFCLVYTIDSGHVKIPSIRETWA